MMGITRQPMHSEGLVPYFAFTVRSVEFEQLSKVNIASERLLHGV